MRVTFRSFVRGRVDNITADCAIAVTNPDSHPWTGTAMFSRWTRAQTRMSHRTELKLRLQTWPHPGHGMGMRLRCQSTLSRRHVCAVLTESGCRRDSVGRLYPVNGNGERCAKPKTFGKSGGSYHDQKRLGEISPQVWWK